MLINTFRQQWRRNLSTSGLRLAFDLGKLDSVLQRLTQNLETPPEKGLEVSLRRMLDEQLKDKISDDALDQHFTQLFTGLESISAAESESNGDLKSVLNASEGERVNQVLKPGRSGDEITKLLSLLSVEHEDLFAPALCMAVVKDLRLSRKNLLEIASIASYGNNQRHKRWSSSQLLWLKLNIANMLWKQSHKRDAMQMLERSIRRHYLCKNISKTPVLPLDGVKALVRGGFAVTKGLEQEIAARVVAVGDKPSLYVLWACAFQYRRTDLMPQIFSKIASPVFASLHLLTNAALTSQLPAARTAAIMDKLVQYEPTKWSKQHYELMLQAATELGGDKLAAQVAQIYAPQPLKPGTDDATGGPAGLNNDGILFNRRAEE